MKLSKSKLALAKVINENGGWPSDEANFAAQDKIDGESDDNTISFYSGKVKPTRLANNSMWRCENSGSHFMGYEKTISGCELIANWHQTCLSREEYYHAHPNADADGWIEWGGGERPVSSVVMVDTKHRCGRIDTNRRAGSAWWHHSGSAGDIVSYRLHKPEVKPEFCESVIRSIPDPESKPTIEQLAQDYRNAKDYADRKQQEADEAKADVEAKLKELELACEAIGLLVSPIIAKQEHELAAAVKVGDEVECVESNIKRDKYNGMVGRLHTIDESDTSTPYLVDFGGNEKIWCHKVKLIRRP